MHQAIDERVLAPSTSRSSFVESLRFALSSQPNTASNGTRMHDVVGGEPKAVGRTAIAVSLIGAGLAIAWGSWFLGGSIGVHVSTTTAQIESTPPPRRIQTAVSGTIVSVEVELGQRVEAGTIIARLDDRTLQLERDEAQARLERVSAMLQAVERRESAEAERRDALSRTASANQRGARVSLEVERLELERDSKRAQDLARLGERSVATDEEIREASTKADVSRLEAERGRELLQRATWERASSEKSANVEAELTRERIAELEGTAAELRAQLLRLDHVIAQRQLIADSAGTIGSIESWSKGAYLAEGTTVATLIPDAAFQVVVQLPASAAGRVVTGDSGTLWLQGYPWAEFGTVPVRVERVASESSEGTLRAELLIDDYTGPIPIQHGMVGSAEIEVERASPFDVVLRSIGGRIVGQ